MLQIRLHGAPCNVRLDNGKVMSGKKAADHLAKTIKATGNSPINFVSCYGAAGGAISNAQMLANKTCCPVKGYTKKISPVQAGNNSHAGKSRVFHPQSPLKAKVCGITNQTAGSLIQPGMHAYNFLRTHLHP